MKRRYHFFKLFCYLILFIPVYSQAQPYSLIEKRLQQEKKGHGNSFLVSLYRPTYLLPGNYTTKPYQEIYANNTPQKKIDHTDVKFQFSFKIPIWQNVLDSKNNILYVAYTQQSYWQAYANSAFFRETNYEPELFISHQANWKISGAWKLSLLNAGAAHQSNGRGGFLERSWNRIYGEAIFSNPHWLLSIKPWVVIRDDSYKRYNENLAHYLGYERLMASYEYNHHVFSIEARNTFESGFSRGAIQASWSFPLNANLRGYAELFTGYGQNLLEYDHYTHAVGIGIALNDWI